MAKEVDGSLCAIQCKCYADDGAIDMKTVSTFLAKAASLEMKHKMLVYTGDNITGHAEKVLKKSRCQILTQSHFRDSSINWSRFPKLERKNPKKLREHQTKALDCVLDGLESHDRGQMIMACGTGKTLTALHVAERHSGTGKIVLYLVPSISLILQTMREWSENANISHNYIVVCSDKSTGEDGSITELESPVSTDVKTLKNSLSGISPDSMTVVFSTYHSLPVVKGAASKIIFDIVFCDEAHRTTGVEDKSFFTLIHKDANVRARKRLYMTATPRVYSDVIRAKTGRVIYSMNDEKKYGPILHSFNFSQAVKAGVLSDFRVKIAIVPEGAAPIDLLRSVAHKDNEIPLDEQTHLAAVWHGVNHPDDNKTPKLLQRVIAFANKIDRSLMFAGEITDQNNRDRSLKGVADSLEPSWKTGNDVDVRHIDGRTRAIDRRKEMNWLKDSSKDPNTCRILSNARCLSEGVDVPALDGVIFLNPRKSKVDVVQSVGRVMRRSPGKDYGYVILPVALPPGKEYHETLDDNKTFRVVWQVLTALRSHDENFANEINRLILDRNTENTSPTPRISIDILGKEHEDSVETQFFKKIKSKLVEKVGDRYYYDRYGRELGKAAYDIEALLTKKLKQKDVASKVQRLRDGLAKIINDSVTVEETVRVISQHMVMSRVFDALFQGEFTSRNPVSATLRDVVKRLNMSQELESLEGFYEQVESELGNRTTREARQNFIKKIYDNFFKAVAKKETEQLGIVYTPVELIDFILNSVQDVLTLEFGTDFADRQVKVLDPFTGTGTFLTRLLESGMLGEGDNFYRKYKHDLYANEVVLLAYYIATVNIETTYSSLRDGNRYVPFDGISYTDTLMLNPRWRLGGHYRHKDSKIDVEFRNVHERIRHQEGSHLHVIVGNPPYSAGQSNFNDQNQNAKYDDMDKRIKGTYLERLNAINPALGAKNSLYDSYVRSIRWASDRIGDSGVIGFVTNASFIRSEAAAGIRACLQEEFTDIWIFDLLGKKGMKGHGRNVFEYPGVSTGGTTTQIAIVILVKNPDKKKHVIHYSALTEADYSGSDKRLKVKKMNSINGIKDWKTITPDKHHDWLDKRTEEFSKYLSMGKKNTKKDKKNVMFMVYHNGVKTKRDAWAYNSSQKELGKNMIRHIEYCNSQNPKKPTMDAKSAKWSSELSDRLKKYGKQRFERDKIRPALYRPFFKQYLYLDKIFTQQSTIAWNAFPHEDSENLAIVVPDKGDGRKFSSLITDRTPDLHIIEQSQVFPFKTKNRSIGGGAKEKENLPRNLCIIVPYKIQGEFSVFITDTIPDLEVIHHGQVFPFQVMTK